jgi:TusA-related sulfurtransferase
MSEHLDAGWEGCGSSLPREFRAAIGRVGPGETVTVTVRDPSAKADLPSLARLLGHRVLSEEPFDDGRLVIIVERGT